MNPHTSNKLKVLVAPLDWGLGHTTRCIPIIYELLACGAEVLLAGNEVQKALLSKEFPACTFLNLEGYNISYSTTGKGFVWGILKQTPAMLKAIRRENKWLNKVINEHKIDAVISDNRFGLHSKKVPCVFITHQLLIKNGLGKFAENILQQFNYSQINKFHTCWIPDFENTPNLAGDLSHPDKMPEIPCKYIGVLSRIEPLQVGYKTGHLLVLLSGPEPQRTIFENIILKQLEGYKGTATFVRGKPAEKHLPKLIEGVIIHNHLTKEELTKEMCRAEYIVCRSGYSSVMDIAQINAKPIFVPTPGQTEQEYLADYLSKQKFCISAQQHDFDLQKLLAQAANHQFDNPFRQKKYNLSEVVQNFIADCLAKKKTIHP